MAEGGGSENEGQSIIVGDSECVFDFYCEVCRDDGKHVEAAGYCVDCEEYLCGPCINSHKRARPSRYHKILDDMDMPKDTPLSQDRISKVITTTCEAHIGEAVKFYCKVHHKFGCSTCFASVHKACKEIDNITEKSETILDSDEFKTFVQNITTMKQTLSLMVDQIDVNISETERCCLVAIGSVKEFRKKINNALDCIEQQFTTQIGAFKARAKKHFEGLAQEVSDLSERIGVITTETDELQTSRRVCQLYINMKEMDSEVKALQKRLRQLEGRKGSRSFEFEPNTELVSLLKKPETFGNLVFFDDTNITERDKYTTAVHVSDIDISLGNPMRTNYYLITGSAFISPNRLVIADHTENEIKIIDTESYRIIDRHAQSNNPSDIANIDNNRFAVTLYNARQIVIFRVDGKMKVEKMIRIADRGRGIGFSKGRLLVSFQQNPRIEIMDLDGNIIKTIKTDTDSNRIFSYPRHLCVSNDGNIIYVSDMDSQRVVRVTFGGVVKAIYTGLKTPRQLCTDQYGAIFVCGEKEKTVHILSPNLNLIKVILTEADGLNKDALSVSHCRNTDRLCVGMAKRHLKLYKLS